jgi:hypothetical protein
MMNWETVQKDCEYFLLTHSDTHGAFFNVLISALFNSMQLVWSMLFGTLHVLVIKQKQGKGIDIPGLKPWEG